MTRFARAKGSKAANERAPEDGTPWDVMKEQLLQSKKQNEEAKSRQEVEQQRIQNYENFLNEQKVKKREASWCDFPESAVVPSKKPKKSKKNKNQQEPVEQKEPTILEKLNQGEANFTEENQQQIESNTDTVEVNATIEDRPKKNKKKSKHEQNNRNSDEHKQTPNPGNSKPEQEQHKNKKCKDKRRNKGQDKPQRRKVIDDKSFQIIINGREVELTRYDGFPIMKKDAERLEELKNNMIKKGIPKGEVQRTMKLERRRAEKALARIKRDVCYNCRKGGHNLSDCPELKSKIPGVDAADGLCFKCGSTEHRQFECKVQREKEFRFASCFICKEQGHIARQCPDNPKGLYPNGGCCKLCGDVTHLRKDCPTANSMKEETTLKLGTLSNTDSIEGVEQNVPQVQPKEEVKKPKKIRF